ncbi:sigma-54-dependent Fis family transcriptional regulator [Mucilaginibacter sp. ZT4R22]|uniref:Sigma-54-dependent Fis family transcriptional regulator n=1 Tax=Mucilaginibacter pankratovii TaxID=2772110 RepID=A0ABR7WSY1_9SPHI|nr:sigma-54 dependent transcriptional regulator [Mucilaginibacter pankratovii]MBD1365411.1 sigma-54-dependent Fis family transcriptional regulator [Mucilaginibacter pankratovii]
MTKSKILIVEDQFIEAFNLQAILERAGYQVCSVARSVPTALIIVEKEKPDMVLLDISLQGNLNGIDLARALSEKNIGFVFLSANSQKQFLEAAKLTKPYGFLVKPFREKDVLVMLDIACYLQREKLESAQIREGLSKNSPALLNNAALSNIIGTSRSILEVIENINIVGQSDTSVLILGESGTGKELVAQCIHQISSRKAKPLVIVNCAALPANLIESELFGHEKGSFTGAINKRTGKFEQADGGTIFLDEIGELPLELQVRFLRVLQEKTIEPIGGSTKKINVRVIAATNRKLEDEIASCRFRMDLYYRLNVFPIEMPALRERKEDIISLANHFINIFAQREGRIITGFTESVMKKLLDYSWPGNVRELENLMERSVLLAKSTMIESINFPKQINSDLLLNNGGQMKSIEENERDHILAVLEKCKWKISGKDGAAEMLKINVSTLNSRIKKLGLIRSNKKIDHL